MMILIKLVIGLLIQFAFGEMFMSSGLDLTAEHETVEETIRSSLEWPFPEKNLDKLYSAMAQDSSFFIFHPDSGSTIVGFDAFKELAENFFMKETCQPKGIDIRDLRISLSRTTEVAWFSAILDDWGEMNGQPWFWKNARWTGVLEKRDGRWQIVQMHFSFASDSKPEETGSPPSP
jgi:hypothetical protein